MEENSKEYSWKWITASELLSRRPCEICNLTLTCDGANCYATIYDGESASGKIVATVKAGPNRSLSIDFHHHTYCRRGLFVDLDTDGNCLGMYVQWIERPQGI